VAALAPLNMIRTVDGTSPAITQLGPYPRCFHRRYSSRMALRNGSSSLVQIIGTDDQPAIRVHVYQVDVYPSVGYAASDLP